MRIRLDKAGRKPYNGEKRRVLKSEGFHDENRQKSLLCALLLTLSLLAACADSLESEALREENERLRAEASSGEVEQTGKITVSLNGKSERITKGRYNTYYVSSLQFSFTNHTDKTIKGVQGNITIMNMFGETLYAGTMPVDGLSIEPGQTAYRQVTDYEYQSEFSPSFIEYDQIERSVEDVCGTIYKLSAEDMLIDFQLTAVAYADGAFERFD